MWERVDESLSNMYSSMPMYSINNQPQQRAAVAAAVAAEGVSPKSEARRPSASYSPTAPVPQALRGFDDFLEPAIEGPPSPERIRALSNMMKRNSSVDKHRSEITTSSGSSSRLSGTSDRPSWNPSMESLSLSRNPSQRSTSGGLPSRDRHDSVQFFGKAIFNRRGKLRRESSDKSSSNSSLDVVEMPIEATSAAPKDHFIQSVFTRRRALRGETGSSSQKKLQISGPFNFEHLTHTHKDSVPDLDRTSRMELMSEFSRIRSRRPTEASLSSIHPNEPQFVNFSTETLFAQEDPSAGLNAEAQSQQTILPQPPPLGPIRVAKRAQSQDKIRFAPPRPPRSPTEYSFRTPMIQPPPRTSSRVSVRNDSISHLRMASIDRPTTSSSFRQPQPFAPVSPKTVVRSPPASRDSPVAGLDYEKASDSRYPPQAAPTTDNAAWPLPNNVNPLPDVPEEEEQHTLTRQSRMSVTSNHSSLKGSISVPLLRQLTLTRTHQRPPSNASETLGRLEYLNNSRALRVGSLDDQIEEDVFRESWEDDIDYCYEHAAEADCDYAWERPSCDISRGSGTDGSTTTVGQTETLVVYGGRLSTALLLSPGSCDVPVLSPVSQISNATQQEAITPTNLAIPVTSNFSLPRRDSSAPLNRGHTRTNSPALSFQESQGFSISPSLLIPNDYHQQMLRYEREDLQDSENDEDYLIQGATLDDEPILRFGSAVAPSKARSSACTIDSTLSEHSMTSSRHKSTNSSSTAFTRWTGSSASSWQARDSQPIIPPSNPLSDSGHASTSSSGFLPPGKVVTLTQFPGEEPVAVLQQQDPSREKHARTHSHADLLMKSNYDSVPPAESRMSKEPLKTRRRARTTSRSHAAPQFALFPSVNGNRI
ncbi:hypothetical protein AAE478_003466 [Parahypoxylon ruwenzoriense]